MFQVRKKDFAFILIGGVLTYSGVFWGEGLGFWQGSFLGAFILVLFAGIYSMLPDRPQTVIIITDIMILVPGASAYFGLQVAHTKGTLHALSAE